MSVGFESKVSLVEPCPATGSVFCAIAQVKESLVVSALVWLMATSINVHFDSGLLLACGLGCSTPKPYK